MPEINAECDWALFGEEWAHTIICRTFRCPHLTIFINILIN
jgi:hypothetical protein